MNDKLKIHLLTFACYAEYKLRVTEHCKRMGPRLRVLLTKQYLEILYEFLSDV